MELDPSIFYMAASLLSLCLRLVMESSPLDRWDMVNRQGINRFSVTKMETNEPSRFSSADSLITHRAYIEGPLKKGNYTKVKPCFFTKSVRFGRTELSICRICAGSRDLEFQGLFFKK